MVNRSALKAIVLATTCLTPLAAFADTVPTCVCRLVVAVPTDWPAFNR